MAITEEPVISNNGDAPLHNNGGNSFSNPLFLANSDNSTTSLVSVLFDGNNFLNWSRNVKRALGAKNKLGFIEGFTKRPDTSDHMFHQWQCCDYMVIGWILNSLKPKISIDFSLVESAENL